MHAWAPVSAMPSTAIGSALGDMTSSLEYMSPHGRIETLSFGCFHAFFCDPAVLNSKPWCTSMSAAPVLGCVSAASVSPGSGALTLFSRSWLLRFLTFFLTLSVPIFWRDIYRLPDTNRVAASSSCLTASVLASFVSRFCVAAFQHCLQSLCSRSFPDLN